MAVTDSINVTGAFTYTKAKSPGAWRLMLVSGQ
jgi:hypothetical protein